MKHRSLLLFLILLFVFPVWVFSQQTPSIGALRDYVGLINKSYHPGIVTFFEKIKADLEKNGQSGAVKAVDLFLKGATGSGFVIAGTGENFYVVTNYHVIQQAHSLSITFERQDNFKKKYENLTVIAADEETDLALLVFQAGDKPSAALSFITRRVEEGEDVYAAGFPAIGATPLWQFSRGMVSNASVSLHKSLLDETLMGPYIQHTAQIDPGNSGGPLLVLQRDAASGYAVAGVNTLSALRRQAANYAIPANAAQIFVNAALNQKPETYRDALDQRLAKFVEGLGENKAAYPHIAEYLSSICVGENAEYAMSEMYDKGNTTVRRAFIEKCEDSVVGAMGYAVAWTIENSIRGQGAVKASLKDVNGSGEEYTVVFTINDKEHSSKWVREYGNWRIRSFGTVAAGDKTLVSQKEAKKETKKKIAEDLRINNNNFHIEAGYANLFNRAPAALYVSADYMGLISAKFYTSGPDFWALGAALGYRGRIPAGNIGFMPYIQIGLDYLHYQEYSTDTAFDALASIFFTAITGQAGLKVTSSYVPGLFVGLAFQYHIFGLTTFALEDAMRMGFSITAGYAF